MTPKNQRYINELIKRDIINEVSCMAVQLKDIIKGLERLEVVVRSLADRIKKLEDNIDGESNEW